MAHTNLASGKGIQMKNDAENIRLLEQYRPRYESLRTAQIKLSAEGERLAAEIAAEEARAVELLGTSDPDELDRIIKEAWADNTNVVNEFVSIIDEINESYRQLAGATDQGQLARPMAPPARVAPGR
jgi:hypothetical protein